MKEGHAVTATNTCFPVTVSRVRCVRQLGVVLPTAGTKLMSGKREKETRQNPTTTREKSDWNMITHLVVWHATLGAGIALPRVSLTRCSAVELSI